jgi:hypothetical protein
LRFFHDFRVPDLQNKGPCIDFAAAPKINGAAKRGKFNRVGRQSGDATRPRHPKICGDATYLAGGGNNPRQESRWGRAQGFQGWADDTPAPGIARRNAPLHKSAAEVSDSY